MAFILKLTDGTLVADFISAGTGFHLEDAGFKIGPAKQKEMWGGGSIFSKSGAQIVANTLENRELEITFTLSGATPAALSTAASTIENLIEAARTRSKDRMGARVELQYAWNAATATTYFEVITGEVLWPDDVMSVEQIHQVNADGDLEIWGMQLTLTVTPAASNISPVNGTPLAIQLTNGNGTDVTTGLAVWNHNDAGTGHDNYVEIDGADLLGNYPMKTVLSLQSDSGESEKTSVVYIGARVGSFAFKSILEDDAASYAKGSPTPTVDVDYSSAGTHTAVSLTSTTGESLFKWTLTDQETEDTRGAFRFFGRVAPSTHWPSNANFRVVVLYGTTSLYASEWRKPVSTTIELFDLGTIFLPPWLSGVSTALAGLVISLEGKLDAAGTQAVDLDYVALLPQDGGYRVLKFRTTGMAQTEYLIDDGWEDSVYHINTSAKKTGIPFGIMQRISLTPAKDVRLYFLMEGTAQNAEITRKLKVIVNVAGQYNGVA